MNENFQTTEFPHHKDMEMFLDTEDDMARCLSLGETMSQIVRNGQTATA